jgi:hypothetical protein
MTLILAGACVVLSGLTLLLAMVVRLIEPGLALSLLAYASTFVGMLLGMMGAVRRARTQR